MGLGAFCKIFFHANILLPDKLNVSLLNNYYLTNSTIDIIREENEEFN